MYSRFLTRLTLVLIALVASNQLRQAQTRVSRSAGVTLQAVAFEPSQLADGALQLALGL